VQQLKVNILADIFLSPNLACLGALERARSPDSETALAFEFDPEMAELDVNREFSKFWGSRGGVAGSRGGGAARSRGGGKVDPYLM
jgi:hypothetical protein